MASSYDPRNDIDAVTSMVQEASNLALRWFRQPLDVVNKLAGERAVGTDAAPFDPVTEADRAVEDALRTALTDRFPDHEVLGEERGLTGSGDHRWIIDPIDGTRAFITGQPLWGTLLGLRHGDAMLAGWLHNPVLGETYVGSEAGSFRISTDGAVRIATSSVTRLDQAVVLCTHPDLFAPGPESDGFARLDRATKMVRYSGDCMNYALLASGFGDLVVENLLQSYDIAALIPIIEHAGGVITGLDGGSAIDGGYVVAAANAELHAAALAVLNG
ncbi:MAG: inositol monophosphatase family protein [Acidimicrobiales bacterium]